MNKTSLKYIKLKVGSDNATIGELIIINDAGKIIKPKNANSKKLKGLFDEQKKYPKKRKTNYF